MSFEVNEVSLIDKGRLIRSGGGSGLPDEVITYEQFKAKSDSEQLAYTGYVSGWPGSGGGSVGILPHLIIIADEGSTTTVVNCGATITPTETSTGHFECDVSEFGTYTIHSVLNGEDAVLTLVVDTVKVYTVDDTHFHADITVTYPSDATCSCSKTGETTLYATGSPYTFTVHSSGTWTITVSKSGLTWTQDVVVTTKGQTFNIKPVPNGNTVTANNITTWLYCAGIFDSNDTTLSDVLSDTSTLLDLMNDENAVNYLVRSTDLVSTICASSNGMSAIGSSDYASETLLADSTWEDAIWDSDYVANVMNVQVPLMTSATAPNGVVSSYREQTEHPAYHAFDRDSTTWYQNGAGRGSSDFIQYDFVAPVVLSKVVVTRDIASDIGSVLVKGSNDNYYFSTISVATTINQDTVVIDVTSNLAFRYIRLQCNDSVTHHFRVRELQFYGRDKGGIQTWLRKAEITNKTYTTLDEVLSDSSTLQSLISNQSAVDYLVNCKIFAKSIVENSNAMSYIGLNNYCTNTLIANESWCCALAESDYAKSIFNIYVPPMSSNTTPSGVCSAYRESPNEKAFGAFDNDTSTKYTNNATRNTNDYIQYQFDSAKLINVSVIWRYTISDMSQFVIQGSNDGVTWTSLTPLIVLGDIINVRSIKFNNNTYYMYYRLQNEDTHGFYYFAVNEIQFYGREDV